MIKIAKNHIFKLMTLVGFGLMCSPLTITNASIVTKTHLIPVIAEYTNTQGIPVGNTAPAPQPGQNPNPESPAIYPQNQNYINSQLPTGNPTPISTPSSNANSKQ